MVQSQYTSTVFLFLFVEVTLANIVWYLIGIIPLGPALGALLGATIRVIEEDDFSEPGRDFRRYYRKNVLDSLKIWLPFLVLLYLFSVNINYYLGLVEGTLMLLGYFFIFLTLVLILYLIPVFLIQIKLRFRYGDTLLKLGWYYFFMKLKLTVENF
ncbi:MAG: DUF624 domain-containing protein [Alkalibacterium sp.]|nr:DUF624 domain-containing protein [Alkalibacterium sp.]